eukprot:m.211891 g.211891  ORF g.211891 m.211891 type:complete len:252 (+) comp10749_c0_seq1:3041-3796(+)
MSNQFSALGSDFDALPLPPLPLPLSAIANHPASAELMAHQGEDGDTPFVVLEFCHKGSLFNVLQDEAIELPWSKRTSFALDAARGLQFLHDKGRIHRDVKSLNMLVTKHDVIKVADFGTARKLNKELLTPLEPELLLGKATNLTSSVGSPPWMAPEVLDCKPYGIRADIYGFGILLWEIASRQQPYETYRGVLATHVINGGRPELAAMDPAAPSEFVKVMTACWDQEPQQRPLLPDVCSELGALLIRLEQN